MRKKPFQARQGDVFLESIAVLPSGLTPVPRVAGRLILAEGEATGHHHAIAEREAELLVDDKAQQVYLRIMAASAHLVHEEHGTITVEPGTYKVTRQREYSPETLRNVRD